MLDHPLLNVLSNWPGRPVTEVELERRGFSIHREWQNKIEQYCGTTNATLLSDYWDAVAIETVGSVGQGDPDGRQYVVWPKNRSSLLDSLAEKIDYAEPNFKFPPLVKCLFEYRKKLKFDRDCFLREVSFFKRLKLIEAEKLRLNPAGWEGRKRDAVPFVARISCELGFAKHRNRYRKEARNGTIFDIGIDLQGRPECVNLPLVFSIFHTSDPESVFQLALFERIVPGFDRYAHCTDAIEFVLGMRAHIELFDILATQLDH